MNKSMQRARKGFTLVELAIVVTIVGLLIGGTFKGLEMLENSRLTGTIMQVRSIQAGIHAFKTAYKDLPGDIQSPSTRLLNCTGLCANGGNGDGIILEIPTSGSVSTVEANTMWRHMHVAQMLIAPNPAPDGIIYMEPQMSGGSFFTLGYHDYSGITYYQFGGQQSGHWLFMVGKPTTSQAYSIPVNKLALLDLKGDDGKPWSGNMLLMGVGCGVATVADTPYDPSNKGLCAFMFSTDF